jgi:hypothetical protein
MRFAAGMVQNGEFSENIVGTSKALTPHNDNKLHRPSLLCKVPLDYALDLERVNTALSLPWDSKYQLRKLCGHR